MDPLLLSSRATIRPLIAIERPARLTRARRLTVYAVGAGLWLSGGLWLVFHYFIGAVGEFGERRHPLEAWWLTAHGACAFASLWLLGLLWGVHMVKGWSSGQRRWSGSGLLAALAVLIASGYLLYYLGDERLRAGTSLVHWALGLGAPILFVAHRWLRRAQPGSAVSDASATSLPMRANDRPLSRRRA